MGGGAAHPGAACEVGSRRLRRAARGDTHIADGYGAGALRRAAALERRHHEPGVLPAAVARRAPLEPQPEARLHGALGHPPPGSIRWGPLLLRLLLLLLRWHLQLLLLLLSRFRPRFRLRLLLLLLLPLLLLLRRRRRRRLAVMLRTRPEDGAAVL